MKIGDKFEIQCYKHNGKVHRYWSEAVLLDVTNEYCVFGNNKTTVIEAQGNYWKTKEPAIIYFFKDKWYNIIAQLKKDGVYYYCNIATPYIIEDQTIKYIDYDLDLRVFPNGEFRVLDMLEYKNHKKSMNYSSDLDIVVNNALKDLISFYKKNNNIFNVEANKKYFDKYIEVK